MASLGAATRFYSECLGLLLVTPLDVPGALVQRALLAASLEPDAFGLELLDGGPALAPLAGRWEGRFVLSVPRREACLAALRAAGGERFVVSEQAAVIPIRNPSPVGTRTLQVRPTRPGCFWFVAASGLSRARTPPWPLRGHLRSPPCAATTPQRAATKPPFCPALGQDVVSTVRDVDGYTWQLFQAARSACDGPGSNEERVVALVAPVPDLAAALAWLGSVLGMACLHTYRSASGYASALLEFAPLGDGAGCLPGPVLELTQAPTDARDESGLAHLVVATGDLATTAANLKVSREEEGGEGDALVCWQGGTPGSEGNQAVGAARGPTKGGIFLHVSDARVCLIGRRKRRARRRRRRSRSWPLYPSILLPRRAWGCQSKSWSLGPRKTRLSTCWRCDAAGPAAFGSVSCRKLEWPWAAPASSALHLDLDIPVTQPNRARIPAAHESPIPMGPRGVGRPAPCPSAHISNRKTDGLSEKENGSLGKVLMWEKGKGGNPPPRRGSVGGVGAQDDLAQEIELHLRQLELAVKLLAHHAAVGVSGLHECGSVRWMAAMRVGAPESGVPHSAFPD